MAVNESDVSSGQTNTRSSYSFLSRIAFIALPVLLVLCILVGRNVAPWSLGEVARTAVLTPAIGAFNSLLAQIATLLLLAITLLGFRRGGSEGRVSWLFSGPVFVLVTVATILLWRWPFFAHFELNPDESQDLAAAITLLRDPRYWQSADTMTHGPLISWVLTIPALFGLSLDYAAARLVGIGLMGSSVLALYGVLASLYPRNTARLLTVPAILCIAWMSYPDFLAYNGEHLIIFLCSVAGYFGVRARDASGKRSLGWNLCAGLLIGMVPYAKFQGIPIAAMVSLLIFAAQSRPLLAIDLRQTLGRVGVFCLGAVIPTAFTLGYVLLSGIFDYFVQSFIVWTLEYAAGAKSALLAQTGRSLEKQLLWPMNIQGNERFWHTTLDSVIWAAVGLALLSRWWQGWRSARGYFLLPVLGLLFFLSAYFAVWKAQRDFDHYLLLLVIPGSFVNAVVWGNLFRAAESVKNVWFLRGSIALFAVINIALPGMAEREYRSDLGGSLTDPILRDVYKRNAPTSLPERITQEQPHVDVANAIKRYSQEEDTIAVWGWMARYHVMSGRRQATRDSVIARVLNPAGYRDDRFLSVYLSDLDKNRPVVFVDAVAPNAFLYHEQERFGPAIFPDLARRLQENYRLVETIKDVRIYVRKDRLRD